MRHFKHVALFLILALSAASPAFAGSADKLNDLGAASKLVEAYIEYNKKQTEYYKAMNEAEEARLKYEQLQSQASPSDSRRSSSEIEDSLPIVLSVVSSDKPTAELLYEHGDTITVHEGDVLEKTYTVRKITIDKVEVVSSRGETLSIPFRSQYSKLSSDVNVEVVGQ